MGQELDPSYWRDHCRVFNCSFVKKKNVNLSQTISEPLFFTCATHPWIFFQRASLFCCQSVVLSSFLWSPQEILFFLLQLRHNNLTWGISAREEQSETMVDPKACYSITWKCPKSKKNSLLFFAFSFLIVNCLWRSLQQGRMWKNIRI